MAPCERDEMIPDESLNLSRYNKGAISDKDMSIPHDNDVLCGRGGNINIHPGNETFRRVVEEKKRFYLTAHSKSDKRRIADSIITTIKSFHPPGRFLAKSSSTGLWHEIGYEKARDKTLQALREGAPSIRREIEDEHDALRESLNIKRKKLQIMEQGVRRAAKRAAERHYTPNPENVEQQKFYNEYHGERIMPSEIQEHLNTVHPHPYTRPIIDNHSHPYRNRGYQLPTDQDYAIQRVKKLDTSRSSLPTSDPNIPSNCLLNEMVERAGNFCAGMDSCCITSQFSGEGRKIAPILTGDENKKPTSKKSRSHEEEIRRHSFEHSASKCDDGLCSIEISPYTRPISSTIGVDSSSHTYHATTHDDHSHPYRNRGYQLPTDQDYAMQRIKKLDTSRTSLPTSNPNIPSDYLLNKMVERAGNFCASMDSCCIASQCSGEGRKTAPILTGDEKQSRAHEKETRSDSFKHSTSKGDDSLYSMEIGEFSLGTHDSNESIRGQSLTDVFDSDIVRSREVSEMSDDSIDS